MPPGLLDRLKELQKKNEEMRKVTQNLQASSAKLSAPVVPAIAPSGSASASKMTTEMFERFRSFIYEKTGIYFTDNKQYLLEGRIAKRVEANKLKSFEEYFTFLGSSVALQREMPSLFEVITINETYFFRNEPQFYAAQDILIPEILDAKRKRGDRRFKIWSAASSSGEEAYTLAMIINERIRPRYPEFQFEVVGTDISPAVLEKARQGIYREYSIRNIPQPYMSKYFTQQGQDYHLSDDIRRMVRFSQLNLSDAAAMRSMQSVDLIFCCNVLIYFNTESKQKVVAHLFDSLNPGGYLFIGYSESLHGISKAFHLVHLPKTIAYRKD